MRSVFYILGGLADEDVEWFLGHGEPLSLVPGDSLVIEGQPLDAIFILLEGSVRVFSQENGATLSVLQAGELVGELSLLDSRPPSASVSAVEATRVLRIPRNRLNAKLQADLGFASRMYRAMGVFLAQRLRRMIEDRSRGDVGGGATRGERSVAEELDPSALDDSALAGTRFLWMLRRVTRP